MSTSCALPVESKRAAGTIGLASAVFRPVQYLGNKLRVLDRIAEAAESLAQPAAHVVDLFSGSSVVAQALARCGYCVTAVDTQEYARVFATATLGIGRTSVDALQFGRLPSPAARDRCELETELWEAFERQEAAALAASDAERLRDLYAELPLTWRVASAGAAVTRCTLSRTACAHPLLTSVYSGTYFGVKQALALDRLRHHAEQRRHDGVLSGWQYSSYLTAIMAAASAAVHSAGKHFAQHLAAGSSGNLRFLNQRLLADRRIDVQEVFTASLAAIERLSPKEDARHTALAMPAEEFVQTRGAAASLYYLDPPYTAQQYSRFYHVLETITSYRVPDLTHGGKVTAGLYPRERYKSAFSSKLKARAALRSLLDAAQSNRVSLLISYSQSQEHSVGNARMVSFDDLISECRSVFGPRAVEWERLGHRYRQFNSASNANELRDDTEILITCKML